MFEGIRRDHRDEGLSIRAELGRQEIVDAYTNEDGGVHLDGSLIRNAARRSDARLPSGSAGCSSTSSA